MIDVQYLPPGVAHGAIMTHNVGSAKTNHIEADYSIARKDSSVAFWRAVILQQVKDARNKARTTCETQNREAALRWLRGGRDFKMVCEFAGLNPDTTLKSIHKALADNMLWEMPQRGRRRL